MNEDNKAIPKSPKDSKAGITVCLNQNEGEGPFEATVYFKKSGKTVEELRGENAIVLTASGRLRLDIGKSGFVEIFAEKSNRLNDAAVDEATYKLEE